MALTLGALQSLINGRIVENSTQEISATDLHELLQEILEYANEHNINDTRISSNISRVSDVNNAINVESTAIKNEIKGTVPTGGDTLKKLYDLIQTLSGGSVPDPIPPGLICMWSGVVPPTGWALCNATGHAADPTVPDLSGRFIIGAKPGTGYANSGNYSHKKNTGVTTGLSIPGSGGTTTHTLLKSNLPRHKHGVNTTDGANISIGSSGSHNHDSDNAVKEDHVNVVNTVVAIKTLTNVNGNKTGVVTNPRSHTHPASSFNGDVGDGRSNGIPSSTVSVNHIPPYYILAYIIKM
ncbi:MAG: phage tail protein [Flavobacteriales bacterium]|nr:phage tail protein [Flavobacteriales bacterium]